MPETKRCSKCGRDFPATLEYFHKDSTGRGGLYSLCKICKLEKKKKYCKENFDKIAESKRLWKINNPDKVKMYRQRWNTLHQDEKREREKIYYANSRETRREYARNYYARNKEQFRVYGKDYRKRNPDKVALHGRNRRAREKNAEGTHNIEDIKLLYERQHELCCYCGVSLRGGYHVDHVIPLSKGGRNDISNLVLACPHCNMSKNKRTPEEWQGLNAKSS